MSLSLYRDTCTRRRWSDPAARAQELRVLFDRREIAFLKRMGWSDFVPPIGSRKVRP